MQNIINFIENRLENCKFCKELECNDDEIKILQFLTKNFLEGSKTGSVYSILQSVFKDDNYRYINNLENIKNLLELGYIDQNLGFFDSSNTNNSLKSSNLSLLHAEVELSEYFLKILEDGKIEYNFPEVSAYEDHLEYLKDQFYRIELYQKKLVIKSELGKKRVDENISRIEEIISKRVEISKFPLKVEQIFKTNSLDKKEQTVFLALLREEYSNNFNLARDINTLIDLISNNDIERIENRALFEEGGRLISSGLIDYDETISNFGNIIKSFFINEDVLQDIIHPKAAKVSKKELIETIVKDSEIFELIEPKTDINDVVLNDKIKEILEAILKQLDKKVIAKLSSWGIKTRKGVDAKIIFYGPPGTGKTMSAVSLAKSLKKQVISFDCSKILSKYVGESEQNVRKIFDTYKQICKDSKSEPVLLLNEADQFLSSRLENSSSSVDKMHNQMQNIFLEQIEEFQGVLIATTNFLKSFDSAFSRRFDFKIEFKKPDFNDRVRIWQKVLPENANFEDEFDVKKLAKFELSGAQIVLVLKNTALKVAVRENDIFTMDDFLGEISQELNASFDKDKKVGLL
ncbi:ATP-binding protein (AAA domain) [Campylobacter blaseri]|uniref:AAA family ATPase n=1 Tax=Campylobacter blaseri TaxID=2042961 RepID=A0A2P8R0V5_9BACT|nr:ATP-binding protein [Campylobacter blaseri]PSM52128.1 AAA family ATPase [Campylobacter blaseri]PSM53894.1 AAA family ATPase [Campylobacter blaseri]QKF85328.1 ATP-binding protein (AAA domain) [Campylobacter blaseri]